MENPPTSLCKNQIYTFFLTQEMQKQTDLTPNDGTVTRDCEFQFTGKTEADH